MKNFFIYIFKIPYNAFLAFLIRSDGHTFSFGFNLISFLRRSPARVKWQGENFVAIDKHNPALNHVFRAQKQGFMAYKKGLKYRADDLANSYFLNEINFMPGDVVLDCGANVGDFFLYFYLNDLQVEYVGFEPSPKEFSCLRRNITQGRVNNIALWSEPGDLTFFVSSQGADSSIIEPTYYDEIVTVKAEQLSHYINSPIKCLKLEAEGAEPEVLIGLGEKLQDIEYICADVGFERGFRQESTLAEVSNILIANNFEMVKVGKNRLCVLFKNVKTSARSQNVSERV